jgi:hypothetical protein
MANSEAKKAFDAINAEYPQATDLQRMEASQNADKATADQDSEEWLDVYCNTLGNLVTAA